jgi:polyhydroxybutyrate depolymerase
MKLNHLILTAVSLFSIIWQAPSFATMTDTYYNMLHEARIRNYVVEKPSSCTANCPLVIDIHGYTSDATAERLASGQSQTGNANGYIVAYPNGVLNSWSAGTSIYGTCCGYAETVKINDVGFIKAMIAKIKIDFPMVDPKRIYTTGISNGCALSQRLAVEASDVIAAASCTSHNLLTTASSLNRPISVTEIHGLQDALVPYEQSIVSAGAQNNFKRWAKLNGCIGTPSKTAITANSYVEEFANCAAGVKVKLYSIKSDHITYLNTDGVNVAQIVWDTLKNNRLP